MISHKKKSSIQEKNSRVGKRNKLAMASGKTPWLKESNGNTSGKVNNGITREKEELKRMV